MIARALTGLLRRSAWLLPPDRAEWLEGLLAEAAQARANSVRVAWLLGGCRFLAGELLRASAVQSAGFLGVAAAVLSFSWPGSPSDSAVVVNRIEVPVLLALLAVLPLLVRRFCGPARPGRLPRAVRAAGYVAVLALVAGTAVEAREGEKLGAYFHDGGMVRGLIVLVLVGYAAMILIFTSRRLRIARSTLAIPVAAGVLIGVALYLRFGLSLRNPPLSGWAVAAVALPGLTAFAVTRVARRKTAGKGMTGTRRAVLIAICAAGIAALPLMPPSGLAVIGFFLILPAAILVPGLVAKSMAPPDAPATAASPAGQGVLAAICATGTATLLLAALTTVTIAVAPQRVPLQTPPPPANGGCETCYPNTLVVPRALRHEYWVGLSVTQASVPFDFALVIAPIFSLLAAGIGVGLAEPSRRASLSSPASMPGLS